MQHIHFGSCGCAEEAKGGLDLYSLNEGILPANIQCFNEAKPDSIRNVICCYEDRQQTTHVVESDCDGEILVHIKFNNPVKVKSFIVASSNEDTSPKSMRVFVNHPTALDFGNLNDFTPTSKIILEWDPKAEKHCVISGNKYNSIDSLYLHINTPRSSDEDEISINYIGIFGNSLAPKIGVVKANYEAVPALKDHTVPYNKANQSMGFGM